MNLKEKAERERFAFEENDIVLKSVCLDLWNDIEESATFIMEKEEVVNKEREIERESFEINNFINDVVKVLSKTKT